MIKLQTYKEFLPSWKEISERINELFIVEKELGIKKLPCLINAPYREDHKPSLALKMVNGHIYFKDFAINKNGNIIELLKLLWGFTYEEVINRLVDYTPSYCSKSSSIKINTTKNTIINIKCRNWETYDFEYWNSYGVSKEILKKCKVLPISYYWVNNSAFRADKLAYAFVLRKNGTITYKIYQPYSFYKWVNNYPRDSWNNTHLIRRGDKIIIASSLKDSMCIMSNLHITSICPQSEGYIIPDNIVTYLKARYKNVYLLYDNDEAGLNYGQKMSALTGFTNIVLPQFEGGKDISDYYKIHKNINFLKDLL